MHIPNKNVPKHDTGLFLTILGVLAVPLVYVLQANGVMEIGVGFSTLIYVGIILVFIWTYLRWKVPHSWTPRKRICVLILICFGLGRLTYLGVSQEYKRTHNANSTRPLDVIQPMNLRGSVQVAGTLTLVINQINTTGKILKVRNARMFFLAKTPPDFRSRAEVEEVMWGGLEDTYKNQGLDQDIPARGEGLVNLQITSPPFTEEQASHLAQGLVTAYFLSVTRDRENNTDLVDTCVFMGPDKQIIDCEKHNKP